jgi:hypothetical protein
MRQLTSLDTQFLALENARQSGHVAGLAILDLSTGLRLRCQAIKAGWGPAAHPRSGDANASFTPKRRGDPEVP